MKKSREMNWKRVRNQTIAFGFFILLIFFIVTNWQENEEVKKQHESNATTAIIYGKSANDFLFSGTAYTVLLEPHLSGKAIFQLKDSQYAAIPKKLFNSVEVGDSISGYLIQGEFMSPNELKSEVKWFYTTLCILLIYPVGYLIYVLFKIGRIESFVNRHDKILSKIIGTILWGAGTIALLSGYVNLAKDLTYGYEKYVGSGFIETDAFVTDTYADYNYQTYAESYFYVALHYKGEDGIPVYLTKEVTSATFSKLDKQLPIKYKKENPYEVFVQKTTAKDTINILMSNTVIIYILMVIITALLMFTLHLMNRKRKTGSYWKDYGNKMKKV